eukprot:12362780-Alexandrium_andersonii.AAC.1
MSSRWARWRSACALAAALSARACRPGGTPDPELVRLVASVPPSRRSRRDRERAAGISPPKSKAPLLRAPGVAADSGADSS